jgi:hypothetical protein
LGTSESFNYIVDSVLGANFCRLGRFLQHIKGDMPVIPMVIVGLTTSAA